MTIYQEENSTMPMCLSYKDLLTSKTVGDHFLEHDKTP
jgi:hypothetical protein